jgi:tetratricopeptide (TPR) repeat protein
MAKKKQQNPQPELSARKKTLFYLITISIPILFFVILEVGLRVADYKGNNALFIDPGIPTAEYLMPNPNFASRYFFYTNTIPNPSIDAFLADKPENGFRVFAMGGSSAAGYPYGFNGTYSRVVQDVLEDVMPDRTVEVINVGVSAINSYTLYDQVDEILEHDPDAILIYAGHNEFYGALGVGSNENLGGFPGFVRFYLKLQRLKTFMLLRSVIVDTGKWIATSFGDSDYDESATLMERIVDSRSIELDSPKHELAMIQFQSNLNAIINEYQKKGIPVFIGSVASNLKDHPPFVDIVDGEQPSAQQTFDEALNAHESGDYESALELFTSARDLDGLKFRAPSDINSIIKSTAVEHIDVHYVPVEEAMAESTEDGIIGFELMLEHLHPNIDGYFIIGKSFAEIMLDFYQYDVSSLPKPLNEYKNDMFITEIDERVAYHRVRSLKQGFPFILGEKPEPYQLTYQSVSVADSLAFRIVNAGLNWDEGKVEMAEYYQSTNQPENAILEYLGLVRNQPWNDSPYVFAARIYLDKNDFDNAEPLLRDAYKINPNDAFITKMLGAIEVQKGNAKEGIRLLEISRSLNPNDSQMLYNLSGAYGIDRQFEKALEIALMVRSQSPRFPGNEAWIQQLESILNR